MTEPRIVLSTHNAKKLTELRSVLAEAMPGFDPALVTSASELSLADVVEDGVTFEQNALIKARFAAERTGLIAIADDSGIAVDVLGGAPGIFSARWSGRHGDDQANNDLLLAQLADVPDEHRRARFVCAAAMAHPSADGIATHVERGEMAGVLLRAPQGNGGFGYDPLFRPDGCAVSSAQLSAQEKNAISHRGRAFRALAPHVVALLGA
ncbi:RdgB/HAM1 family non-canonical purine NTP pyrophosphatase [Helcobacillus massiliensis]|uniref:RdgB/HAM1 family non-canonical purine NTP pyrophosphatase n=1 Tax=Helcobacillus massiliensis TaxID=521392 RepID=UPI0021A321B2|nr:RdgB/HAM1 family non-canonical purine NTP pyrophosphatase [Helcobacillus massiliensis]MCT1557414.1 RdgB/HAM1 family non-canonical purine NTP pyrophosphatase [Helcobacillus massiliensis]MCT2036405.1 RdgB/HAM1 family non-canonical purine NTP pyrophosphatase [Helcobacillus massiliensis]MCT2331853.1 RdgB/HAM1 family non-canonical purine NTP pyrophosphatase [Helcobacillus massiliensis]MDK7742298.1 RdgB/HAM1 family non-canonical purine NTP pyrophosphatase [Helcobacillus massiliensis]WOO93547.1 Rd